MKKPISLSLFNDVRQVLDEVVNKNQEATLQFESASVAHVWLHRANRFRKALRQNNEIERNALPGQGASPYDHLMFSKVAPTTIKIKLRVVPATITFGEEMPERNPYDDEL